MSRAIHFQGNVGVGSKVVLNAPGPPRWVVVPLVYLVHSHLLGSTLVEILPILCIRVHQGGVGAPGQPEPPLVDQEWLLHFPDAFYTAVNGLT